MLWRDPVQTGKFSLKIPILNLTVEWTIKCQYIFGEPSCVCIKFLIWFLLFQTSFIPRSMEGTNRSRHLQFDVLVLNPFRYFNCQFVKVKRNQCRYFALLRAHYFYCLDICFICVIIPWLTVPWSPGSQIWGHPSFSEGHLDLVNMLSRFLRAFLGDLLCCSLKP